MNIRKLPTMFWSITKDGMEKDIQKVLKVKKYLSKQGLLQLQIHMMR